MQGSAENFFMTGHADAVPSGLHLVATLTGFTDAGNTVQQLREHLLDNLDHEVIAVFSADRFYDYRARRPMMVFDGDHLTDYQEPELKLYLMRDELGHPFLLLAGFEPDFAWEAFTNDVIELIEHFEVASTTWLQALPMPVPHTRPIGVTVSGNKTELIDALSVWKPKTKVPANVLQLLEFRLYEAQQTVTGFSLLVPHYLADNAYPTAVFSALNRLSAATGLLLPTGELGKREEDFFERLNNQLEMNSELVSMVNTLEERYDQYASSSQLPTPLEELGEDMPTADDLAEELERFLANRQDPPEQ
ncbi:MAG: PAC2 family protein [Microbacteriaceae bacterium]